MREKIKVTIDRSKWRSGDEWSVSIGKGETSLLNEEGYQCCLGFICEAAGVPRSDLSNFGYPFRLGRIVEGLTSHAGYGAVVDTELTNAAIEINDGDLPPDEKEQSLLELFKDSPYELEFVGEHDRCCKQGGDLDG